MKRSWSPVRNKERYLPIYDSIKNALLDYLEFARPKFARAPAIPMKSAFP